MILVTSTRTVCRAMRANSNNTLSSSTVATPVAPVLVSAPPAAAFTGTLPEARRTKSIALSIFRASDVANVVNRRTIVFNVFTAVVQQRCSVLPP
jgi:hypothetical protein